MRKGSVVLLTLCMLALSGCSYFEKDDMQDSTVSNVTLPDDEFEEFENFDSKAEESTGVNDTVSEDVSDVEAAKEEVKENPVVSAKLSVGSLKLDVWDSSKDRAVDSGRENNGGGDKDDSVDLETDGDEADTVDLPEEVEYPSNFYDMTNGDRIYQEIEDAAKDSGLTRYLLGKGFAFVGTGEHGSDAVSSEEDYLRMKQEGKVYADVTISFDNLYSEKAESVYKLCQSFDRRSLDYSIEIYYGDGDEKLTVEYHEGAEGYPETKPTLDSLRMLFSVG